ncbi:hypothetical protein FRC08_001883 [Ceratobasidium sp. 394]|nr:hypothetical protein FRC08_001883 [Ceratobasidium sp. 394]
MSRLRTASNHLLPSLRRLIVNSFDPVDQNYVNWIPKLLAPSLKEFEMCAIYLEYSSGEDQIKEHWWISGETCMELTDKLYQTCPDIEKLQIFPRGARENQPDNRTTIYTKLASLRHLRSLVLGEADAGQELFQTLGQLQNLENLSIVSDWSEDPPTSGGDPICLSDGLFPALRHLTLSRVDTCIVRRVCDSPQLFRCLISASIIYADENELDSKELRARLFGAMRCFSHGSSHLVDLTILTSGASGYFWLFSSFIDTFKQMPLRRLRLGGVDLNPNLKRGRNRNKVNNPALKWEDFLAAVPGLEELRLDNQSLELEDLGGFASALPNLRLLALRSIEPGETPWGCDLAPGARAATRPITIRYRLYFSCGSLDGVFAYDVSRYTYKIWPNATFEASMDWRDPENHADSWFAAARWNKKMELLRSGET